MIDGFSMLISRGTHCENVVKDAVIDATGLPMSRDNFVFSTRKLWGRRKRGFGAFLRSFIVTFDDLRQISQIRLENYLILGQGGKKCRRISVLLNPGIMTDVASPSNSSPLARCKK